MDAARREKITEYFLSAQMENGGFCGRKRTSDLYYTAFALRGLFLLGGLNDAALQQSVADYLEQERNRPFTAVELSSYIFCISILFTVLGQEIPPEERTWMKERLYRFQKADRCFGTSENTPYSSTYQTFLTSVSLEMLGENEAVRQIPVEPILRRQRADGGFVELEPLRESGTNPTAAAVGFLKLRETEPADKPAAVNFLLQRQGTTGGFQANTKIPIADLLSSFTAMTALNDLNAAERSDVVSLNRFLRGLQLPDGGYFGAEWDKQSDVEYTFYGFALECLLG